MKKFLFDFPTPFKNFYTSEYTSAFLYESDILFLLFFLLLFFSRPLSWWREKLSKFKMPLLFLALFLIFSAFSLIFAGYSFFGIYSFGRLALGILSALAIGAALRDNIVRFKEIAVVISVAAVLESVIGFLQFALQKSAGLWFLGETVFNSDTPGIARIVVNGLKLARAYGTMPHANILAGFLVLGLLSLFYLLIKEEKSSLRIIQSTGIFVVLAGLLVTFSRSGWITAALAALVFIIWELFADKERRRKIIYLMSLLVVVSCSLLIVLSWVIFPRANFSASEAPVADRWSYNKLGLELIISHPLGVGIGNELFYAYHNGFFEKYDVNSLGQWQPIHNLYLMIGTETGILGLVSFIVFITLLLLGVFRVFSSEFLVPCIMLFALLAFGLFDHFLWDLQLGRLMLWVTIGILLGMAQDKNPA
ncbi:MAG: O-antigen ligase family protein [Minisyncoccia bacterium]